MHTRFRNLGERLYLLEMTMMTKLAALLPILAIAVGSSACAARRPRPTLTPETRTAVLARYANGESFDQIAVDFQLGDRDAARDVVHDGMRALAVRYYRDR